MGDAKANLDNVVEGLKPDHKLSLALNGEMAPQIAARTPPDLVLLDINDARAHRERIGGCDSMYNIGITLRPRLSSLSPASAWGCTE